ncbi:MAG: lipopolysaccharide transport periplasmic protein LptA [Gammaproteobacteria bacterium]|nr:lipopolysaccharide transport periplasmic protein LptA [Gammaproteobacteria bacterium]
MPRLFQSKIIGLLALWLCAQPLWALKSDADQPVNLESDSADIDDASRTRIFTGNVLVTQGSIRVSGDRLEVKELGADPVTNRFVATGRPARFQQEIDGKPGELVKGHADRIEYDDNSEFLHLIGNAFLSQEGDTVRTDRITYDRVSSLVKGGASAKGKERVRMVIQSKKDKDAP